MQRPDKTGDIQIRDLTGTVPFKNWLKSSLKMGEDDDISKEHLLIYLDYIEQKVFDNESLEREVWAKVIRDLRERINVL
jgi:hypothetical protein